MTSFTDFGRVWAPLLCLASLLPAGCDRGRKNSEEAAPPSAAPIGKASSAKEVLASMASAYRNATSYADAAQVRLKYQQGGQPFDEVYDYSVTLTRPNKLRLNCYKTMVVSDGETVRAAVEQLPKNVLELPAPKKLSRAELLLDEILARSIDEGQAGFPLQLVLLLEENALDMVQMDQQKTELLEPQDLEGRACYRVQADGPEGKLTFWVDQESYALRRLEFPVAKFKEYLEQQGSVSELSMVADFTGAQLNSAVDEQAFKFEVPEGAKIVKRFAYPPPAPSPLLGKKIGDFKLADLKGAEITPETLKGKVVVLDFWFAGCAPCAQTMPVLNEVYQKYKADDRLAFLAVNVDNMEITGDQLIQTVTSWGSQIPIARTSDQHAREVFQVSAFPTLLVLGGDGTVQDSAFGVDGASLVEVLDKLVAGKSNFEEVQARYERELAAYEQAITQPPDAGSLVEIPETKAAPRSEPEKLAITKLWTASTVKGPGNIMVVEEPSAPPQIFVFDGWKTVVEVDGEGKEVARHELEVPDASPVFSFRTAVDGQGQRYFVAFANAQGVQQLHLFDHEWKKLLSFPPAEDGQHDGIADVEIADLNADGQLELAVGYWGVVGVQGVALDGKRLWRDRSLQLVLRIGVTGPEPDTDGRRSLLCINNRGTLIPLNHEGKRGEEVNVANRFLQSIVSAELTGDDRPELVALSASAVDTTTVVGITADGKEQWTYDLPKGVHRSPVEIINTGSVIGDARQWLLAAADGSIHILDAQGQLVDRFQYGAALTGLAATRIGDRNVILVSTADGLDAWQVSAGEGNQIAAKPKKPVPQDEPAATPELLPGEGAEESPFKPVAPTK